MDNLIAENFRQALFDLTIQLTELEAISSEATKPVQLDLVYILKPLTWDYVVSISPKNNLRTVLESASHKEQGSKV